MERTGPVCRTYDFSPVRNCSPFIKFSDQTFGSPVLAKNRAEPPNIKHHYLTFFGQITYKNNYF